METVGTRSESPVAKSKKQQPLEVLENGDSSECTKPKRKSTRNKTKNQINGTENGELLKHESETNQELVNSGETEKNDTHNISTDKVMNDTDKKEEEKPCESQVVIDELSVNEENGKSEEDGTENFKAKDEQQTVEVMSSNVSDNCQKNNAYVTIKETASSEKKDNLLLECSVLKGEGSNIENIEQGNVQKVNNLTNNSYEDHENIEISTTTDDIFVSELNGSDSESYEKNLSIINENNIEASTDITTKETNGLSQKISNFLEKWNSSTPNQKQDTEIFSKTLKASSTTEGKIPHPYLSKVTGRRGIKDSNNSGQLNFSLNEEEMKTPKNSEICLNDSFRVHTDPPRLNVSDLQETSTLRKFSGKRCLNATYESEEDKNDDLAMSKRQKLNDKASESGFLGNILLSPFKKKSLDNDGICKLKTSESKLSRFLSPFWFWKKSASSQKAK